MSPPQDVEPLTAEELTALAEKLRVLDSDPNGVLSLVDERRLLATVRVLQGEKDQWAKARAALREDQ